MLGERANWVHDLRADGGDALLLHGRREEVHLEEVEAAARPPVLRRYPACAPGARLYVGRPGPTAAPAPHPPWAGGSMSPS